MPFVKGQSGCPAGKPKGTLNKANAVAAEFSKAGSAIAAAVIERALAGDMAAAEIALKRFAPPLRPRVEKIIFQLDRTLPLHQQAQQIMEAIADGQVDHEAGLALIAGLRQVADIKATDELEARLQALEAKNG